MRDPMTDTPVSRLRERHRREYSSLMAGPWCRECTCTWPCDVIAALDALEARIDALQAENARLREQAAALADARRWMMATNDYESLSPAGHSLTRDAISTADAALRAYRGQP